MINRFIQIGPFSRLFFTLLIATGTYLLLQTSLDWHLRLLIAWCVGGFFFLSQVATMFALLHADGVRERCQSQRHEGHAPMLAGGVLIAVVSIAAVIYLLTDVHSSHPFYQLHLTFSVFAVLFSWLILQSMFAIYYARLYYEKGEGETLIAGGLRFTTTEAPDYWDFFYFSITLALSYAVSDIGVTSKTIRRITLFQTLICFFYYTVIIGLVMNVIGTLF